MKKPDVNSSGFFYASNFHDGELSDSELECCLMKNQPHVYFAKPRLEVLIEITYRFSGVQIETYILRGVTKCSTGLGDYVGMLACTT